MEPITDGILNQPANRYLKLPGDARLGDALHQLGQEDGQEWWFLIVDLGDGLYLAARFSEFRSRLEEEGLSLLDIPLHQLGQPLDPVFAVEKSAGLNEAEIAATKSEVGIVLVVEGEECVGILTFDVTRSAPSFSERSLLEIAGMDMEEALLELEEQEEKPKRERSSEQPAQPDPSAPPSSSGSNDIDVRINGDVGTGGRVIVAGDDVNITYTTPKVQTREQMRRFEAAFPQESHLGIEEKLLVAVIMPDMPSPFTGLVPQSTGGTDDVSIAMPVDPDTGKLQPVDIEVSVTTSGFQVRGDDTKLLTVYPDGRITQRWFLLEPVEAGKQKIMIELTYKGRLLDEITIKSAVFTPQVKPRRKLNLKLGIVSFNLQFSFAPATT